MIRSSVDLPEPLRPSTPIFAPGRNDSEMSFSTCLSGGCVRLSLYMVKMYCALTATVLAGARGSAGSAPSVQNRPVSANYADRCDGGEGTQVDARSARGTMQPLCHAA